MDNNTILMLLVILVFVLILLVIGLFVFLVMRGGKANAQPDITSSLEKLTQEMSQTRESVGHNLQSVSEQVKTFGAVQEGLGQVKEAVEKVMGLEKNIAGLQNILSSPKLRGGLGELLLSDLLGQVLPQGYYRMQYSFQNNEKVDAVIFLKDHMLPIDSKFPLENFNKLVQCTEERERENARKQFAGDVRNRINETAKYIRPTEKTLDLAMMYVPAENVYYEIIMDENLMTHASQRKVVPVSPNSFLAYLQVVVFGIRGLQIERNADQILKLLISLQQDFESLADDFGVLGKHLNNAQNKSNEIDKKMNALNLQLKAAENLQMTEGKGGGVLPGPQD